MIDALSSKRTLHAALAVIIAVALLTLSDILVKTRSFLSRGFESGSASLSFRFRTRNTVAAARRTLPSWLQQLHSTGGVRTERTGCRELSDGAQTCVFDGLMCINTSSEEPFGKPTVYFADDAHRDGATVPSDDWCNLRHRSSDPRYWHGRHWPILTRTVAPRWSCLQAVYRSPAVLERRAREKEVMWVPSLWLLDFDYVGHPHNNHFLMDLIWVLDAMLWQKSIDLRRSPGVDNATFTESPGHLFGDGPSKLYLPEGISDFERQTSHDINRLIFALVLQLNISHLYDAPVTRNVRAARPLMEAYPSLEQRLLFHRELWSDRNTSMVCTSRLTAGAKLSTGGHERVCRYIRTHAWRLFGIPELRVRGVGQAHYAVPAPRVVIVQRHISRKIHNLRELEEALREAFPRQIGFEVETFTTEHLATAEGWARVYSRAGVVITPHGSHNMGELFMPRHRFVSSLDQALQTERRMLSGG